MFYFKDQDYEKQIKKVNQIRMQSFSSMKKIKLLIDSVFQEKFVLLISEMTGAIIGSYFAGWKGAALGVFIAWSIPIFIVCSSKNNRLKIRIIKTLRSRGTTELRDIMIDHGVHVPTDCFEYDENHSYVKALLDYMRAISELESENKVIHDQLVSRQHGYVSQPNQWLNDWSGRAYRAI